MQQKTTELEELIQYCKDYVSLTRLNYPELSRLFKELAEHLEELQKLREFGVTKIEVDCGNKSN